VVAYYNSVAASYGFQAGVQKFGYALFFMTNAALDQLDSTDGFELGVGPSLVVVDEGMGKSITTNTITSDVYAFIFSQKGLMAGAGIQGSKSTRISKESTPQAPRSGELTMSCARILVATILALALSATAGRAGEAANANLDILRDTIRANRKALVAANLTLTDEEAGRFWPLYDKYQTELNAVQDRAVKVIQDYTASF